MPALLDHDDGALLQNQNAVGENRGQALDYVRGASVVEAENNDARSSSASERGNLAEVEVEGKYDTALGDGLCEDLAVGQSLKAFVAEMNRVVIVVAQPGDNANVDAHVCKESHTSPRGWLAEVDLLLGQPCGVFEGLLDVLAF